jgi:hypothetical protein
MAKTLALATQLGFAVACPLVVLIGGGVWADDRLGTTPWLFFLGLVLGLLAAGGALYRIATAQPRSGSSKPAGNPPDKIEKSTDDVGMNRATSNRDEK